MLYTVVELDVPRLLIEPKPFSQLALLRIFLIWPRNWQLVKFSYVRNFTGWQNQHYGKVAWEPLRDWAISQIRRLSKAAYISHWAALWTSLFLVPGSSSWDFPNFSKIHVSFHFDLWRLLQNVDLSGSNRILDVGGGDGSLLIELLRWNPHINGAVYDLLDVTSKAEKKFTEHDLQEKLV
ncbi:unnamed protein product [Blepharisma stoltei]|uniref:O-methyltransferase C-terminal domain-containing protein n=1 Tax=Blepharisma stoltei TaxID=1481888 RepID=A0AAU9J9Y8_9CILI|nr:unnamed protein product [Blepharisma stoltei]